LVRSLCLVIAFPGAAGNEPPAAITPSSKRADGAARPRAKVDQQALPRVPSTLSGAKPEDRNAKRHLRTGRRSQPATPKDRSLHLFHLAEKLQAFIAEIAQPIAPKGLPSIATTIKSSNESRRSRWPGVIVVRVRGRPRHHTWQITGFHRRGCASDHSAELREGPLQEDGNRQRANVSMTRTSRWKSAVYTHRMEDLDWVEKKFPGLEYDPYLIEGRGWFQNWIFQKRCDC